MPRRCPRPPRRVKTLLSASRVQRSGGSPPCPVFSLRAVAWVLSTLESIREAQAAAGSPNWKPPPVAVLPLGTGGRPCVGLAKAGVQAAPPAAPAPGPHAIHAVPPPVAQATTWRAAWAGAAAMACGGRRASRPCWRRCSTRRRCTSTGRVQGAWRLVLCIARSTLATSLGKRPLCQCLLFLLAVLMPGSAPDALPASPTKPLPHPGLQVGRGIRAAASRRRARDATRYVPLGAWPSAVVCAAAVSLQRSSLQTAPARCAAPPNRPGSLCCHVPRRQAGLHAAAQRQPRARLAGQRRIWARPPRQRRRRRRGQRQCGGWARPCCQADEQLFGHWSRCQGKGCLIRVGW